MDPGYSTANRNVIEENARKLKIPIEIFEMCIRDSPKTERAKQFLNTFEFDSVRAKKELAE